MLLLLHRVESLKSFVLGTVRGTDELMSRMNESEQPPKSTGNAYKKLWSRLVAEGVLTQEESADLQEIIGFRNEIAHAMHMLVVDVATRELDFIQTKAFDYSALERVGMYRQKIEKRLGETYILALGLSDYAFQEAENVYTEELDRLQVRIKKQSEKRRKSKSN